MQNVWHGVVFKWILHVKLCGSHFTDFCDHYLKLSGLQNVTKWLRFAILCDSLKNKQTKNVNTDATLDLANW